MEVIKNTECLPDWFALDDYIECELSDEEIYWELYERDVTALEAEMGIFIPCSANYQALAPVNHKNHFSLERMPNSVHPLTALEAAGIASVVNATDKPVEQQASAIYSELYEDEFNTYVTVNLEKSDDQILDELKVLLPSLRESLKADKVRKTFKPSDIQKVRNYRVLPLIDLLFWSKLENVKIKQSVLSKCLFPNGEKGEEDFRKTIIPFAEKVSNRRYIDELRIYLLS